MKDFRPFRSRPLVRTLMLTALLCVLSADQPRSAQALPALRASEPVPVGTQQIVPRDYSVVESNMACDETGRCAYAVGGSLHIFDGDVDSEPVVIDGFGGAPSALTYYDGRFALAWCGGNDGVHARVVDIATGEPVSDPVLIGPEPAGLSSSSCDDLRLAGSPDGFLLTWNRYPSTSDPLAVGYARWLDRDGSPDGEVLEPLGHTSDQAIVDVAYDGTQMHLIAAQYASPVELSGYSTIVTDPVTREFVQAAYTLPQSVPLDANSRSLHQECRSDGHCALTWKQGTDDGTEVWAAWRRQAGGYSAPARAFVLDAGGAAVRTTAAENGILVMAVGSVGSSPAASAWGIEGFARRLDSDGTFGEAVEFDFPDLDRPRIHHVEFDGSRFRVFVSEAVEEFEPSGVSSLSWTNHSVLHFSPGGLLEAQRDQVTYGPNSMLRGRAVLLHEEGSSDTLLAWSEAFRAGGRLLATPVDPDGNPIAEQGVVVADDLKEQHGGFKAVAHGAGFVFIWPTPQRQLAIARVTQTGDGLEVQRLFENEIPAEPDEQSSVSSYGERVVVAIESGAAGTVRVLVFDPEQQASDVPDSFTIDDMPGDIAGLSCTDGYCVLASRTDGPLEAVNHFVTFAADEGASDLRDVHRHEVASASYNLFSLGRVGPHPIAVWAEPDGAGGDPHITLNAIDADATTRRLATYDQEMNWLLPPRDYYGTRAALAEVSDSEARPIAGPVRLDDDWEPLDSEPMEAVVSDIDPWPRALSVQPDGGLLVAVSDGRDQFSEGAPQLYLQILAAAGANGETCRNDADCESGICTDSTCAAAAQPDPDAGDAGSAPDAAGSAPDAAGGQQSGQGGGCTTSPALQTHHSPLAALIALIALLCVWLVVNPRTPGRAGEAAARREE